MLNKIWRLQGPDSRLLSNLTKRPRSRIAALCLLADLRHYCTSTFLTLPTIASIPIDRLTDHLPYQQTQQQQSSSILSPGSELRLRIHQSKPTAWRYGDGAFGVCLSLHRPFSHHVARGKASPFGTEVVFLATESGVSPRLMAFRTASKSVKLVVPTSRAVSSFSR